MDKNEVVLVGKVNSVFEKNFGEGKNLARVGLFVEGGGNIFVTVWNPSDNFLRGIETFKANDIKIQVKGKLQAKSWEDNKTKERKYEVSVSVDGSNKDALAKVSITPKKAATKQSAPVQTKVSNEPKRATVSAPVSVETEKKSDSWRNEVVPF